MERWRSTLKSTYLMDQGDGKYASYCSCIILAKVYRDNYDAKSSQLEFPHYLWKKMPATLPKQTEKDQRT